MRAEARRIGQRAIKRAEAERAVEDAAAAQRSALMAALTSALACRLTRQTMLCGD